MSDWRDIQRVGMQGYLFVLRVSLCFMTWVNNEIGFFCLDPDIYELLLYLPTFLFF